MLPKNVVLCLNWLQYNSTFKRYFKINENSFYLSVNLLIDKLLTDSAIGANSVLLAIRPMKIQLEDVSSQFMNYVPPPG